VAGKNGLVVFCDRSVPENDTSAPKIQPRHVRKELAARYRLMTTAKSKIVRPYAPDYVDATTLAYRLNVSESTVEKLEREGKLPRRRDVFGLRRWKWNEVENLIDGQKTVEHSRFMQRIRA
jgi:hypothetical protein